MKNYHRIFREKTLSVIAYSEIDGIEIILESIKTIRGALIPRTTDSPQKKKEYTDKMRVELATRQHEKIHSVESFRELEKCQLMLFDK
jgi:hypothetical protein